MNVLLYKHAGFDQRSTRVCTVHKFPTNVIENCESPESGILNHLLPIVTEFSLIVVASHCPTIVVFPWADD